MSSALYHCLLSLHLFGYLRACKSLPVFFFFSLSIWTLSCFSSLLISPVHSLSPGILSHALFCLSPEERSAVLFLCSFSSNKQCDLSQVSNSPQFKFLPCLKRMMNPFYFPPLASLRRVQWDDHSNGNGCHCWDFLYIRCITSIISLNIQAILCGGWCWWGFFYCTFLPTGKLSFQWSYALPKITQQNLCSDLGLCRGHCTASS